MIIQVNSTGKNHYKIDSLKPGEIKLTHPIEANVYRRKLNSDAELNFVGKAYNGILESELIQENYEFVVFYLDREIDRREFNYTYIWDEPLAFQARTRAVKNNLPENIHAKERDDSNVSKILDSIVVQSEEFDRNFHKLDTKKRFLPQNPLGVDVRNSFPLENESDLFWSGIFLNRTNDIPRPDRYNHRFVVSKLPFGYDNVNTDSADYFSTYTDETGREHTLRFWWNPNNGKLSIQSKTTGDIFFSANLLNNKWEQITQIDGIDATADELFILSDYKLYAYRISLPLKNTLVPFHQCDIQKIYPINGLKIGDSFLATRQFNRYALYQPQTTKCMFDYEQNMIHTFGNVNFLERVALDDMDIIMPIKRENILNSIDEAFWTFGLQRVEGVPTASFLGACAGINFEQILNHHDSISNLIDNTESSIVYRESVNRFKQMFELSTELAEIILKKFYEDNIENARWGAQTW
jgi:hypothetical protein